MNIELIFVRPSLVKHVKKQAKRDPPCTDGHGAREVRAIGRTVITGARLPIRIFLRTCFCLDSDMEQPGVT